VASDEAVMEKLVAFGLLSRLKTEKPEGDGIAEQSFKGEQDHLVVEKFLYKQTRPLNPRIEHISFVCIPSHLFDSVFQQHWSQPSVCTRAGLVVMISH